MENNQGSLGNHIRFFNGLQAISFALVTTVATAATVSLGAVVFIGIPLIFGWHFLKKKLFNRISNTNI
jgi:hypothetical protein